KEKKFIVKNRSANLPSVTVVIVARIDRRLPTLRSTLCIQIPVLEVFVQPAMKLIRPRNYLSVELTTGRMAKLRRKLIRDQRKVRHRIIGHIHKRPRQSLVVIVDSFNREVIIPRTLSANRRTNANSNTAAGSHSGTQQRCVQNAKAQRATRCSGRQIRKLLVPQN